MQGFVCNLHRHGTFKYIAAYLACGDPVCLGDLEWPCIPSFKTTWGYPECPHSSHLCQLSNSRVRILFFCLSALCLFSTPLERLPYHPKVKCILFSFFQGHFPSLSCKIHKKLPFKTITWNMLFSFFTRPFSSPIIWLHPILQDFQGHCMINRDSAARTTNMMRKRKNINKSEKINCSQVGIYDLDACLSNL